MFILPGLFLFIYLIWDTAKYSQQKIRHQFGLDAAAFIEMTNYSDFLNRSAYVNGAFPQRIFYEGFYNTCIESKKNKGEDCANGKKLFSILYDNGDFPKSDQAPLDTRLDNFPTWEIRFGGTGLGKNSSTPDMGNGQLDIITMDNALKYWLSWDDAQDIYKLYVQIYTLLGSVEDAQYSVFKRLTNQHNFLRKSYWLNTRDPIHEGDDGARWFNTYQFEPHPYCIQQVMIYGNKPTSNAFQPYQIYAPNSPITMSSTISNCRPGPGLFQLEAIADGELNHMRTIHSGSNWPGYPVFQHWTVPGNHFGVDMNKEANCENSFDTVRPCVHATIGVTGSGRLWPDPTPKFQTRLYP